MGEARSEEARLGGADWQRMEQGGYDLDLGVRAEGQVTRKPALEPMGAQRVDVKVCLPLVAPRSSAMSDGLWPAAAYSARRSAI